MIGLVLGLALAAPPADLDLADLAGPTDRAAAAMRGPPGCWDAVGVRTWAWQQRGVAYADGEEAARGRLVDGVWVDVGDPPRPGVLTGRAWEGFQPVVGRVPGASQALPTVLSWLGALHGAVETSWLRWDGDRDQVVLEEAVALGDLGTEVSRRTWLDGDLVTSAEATYPPVRLGAGAQLVGAGWEVVFTNRDGVALPSEEFAVVRVRTGGRIVRGHQQLRWSTWQPCPAGG